MASEHETYIVHKSQKINPFAIAANILTYYDCIVKDFEHSGSGGAELHLTDLHPETRQALATSASRNGRTVQEEAEFIIKTHLSTCEDEAS